MNITKMAIYIYRYELSNENGSRESKDSVFTIFPTSPMNKTSMGCFWLISYSDKVCRQAPQGPTGLSTVLVLEAAEIAIFFTTIFGYVEPAFQIATRSAHIPEG